MVQVSNLRVIHGSGLTCGPFMVLCLSDGGGALPVPGGPQSSFLDQSEEGGVDLLRCLWSGPAHTGYLKNSLFTTNNTSLLASFI